MATQSFTKEFIIDKYSAEKLGNIIDSSKKITMKKDYLSKDISKDEVKKFLRFKKYASI